MLRGTPAQPRATLWLLARKLTATAGALGGAMLNLFMIKSRGFFSRAPPEKWPNAWGGRSAGKTCGSLGS